MFWSRKGPEQGWGRRRGEEKREGGGGDRRWYSAEKEEKCWKNTLHAHKFHVQAINAVKN